jgi:hypothetical protein
MARCPVDHLQCWDDLCYGGGCMRMDGASMEILCNECGKWHGEEDEFDLCTGGDEWDDYEEDGPLDLEDAFDRTIERAFARNPGVGHGKE